MGSISRIETREGTESYEMNTMKSDSYDQIPCKRIKRSKVHRTNPPVRTKIQYH